MVPSVITLRFSGILETPWAVILPMWFFAVLHLFAAPFHDRAANELFEAGHDGRRGHPPLIRARVLPVCRPGSGRGGRAVVLGLLEPGGTASGVPCQPHRRPAVSVLFNQISTDNSGLGVRGRGVCTSLPALYVYFFSFRNILRASRTAS
jgi:multiple sugar transport system permease protein